MADQEMGAVSVMKQKKQGKPSVLFNKHEMPDDKESTQYKMMVDFLNKFNVTPEQYVNLYQSMSETSMHGTNASDLMSDDGTRDV